MQTTSTSLSTQPKVFQLVVHDCEGTSGGTDVYEYLETFINAHKTYDTICLFHVNSKYFQTIKKQFAPEFECAYTFTTRWYGELIMVNRKQGNFILNYAITKCFSSFDNNIIHHLQLSISDDDFVQIGIASAIDSSGVSAISPKHQDRVFNEILKEIKIQQKDLMIIKSTKDHLTLLDCLKKHDQLYVYTTIGNTKIEKYQLALL